MKNFSAVIDLGRFDCCAVRRGSHQIEFLFYMRNEADRTQVEASTTQQFGRQQRVVELFWPRNADDLKRYAQRALLLVQQTMIANQQALRAGEQIVVENPQLES